MTASGMDFPPAERGANARSIADRLWQALGGGVVRPEQVEITGAGALPSVFAVSDFAAGAVAAAGLALAEWIALHTGAAPQVTVDRRLASLWFGFSISPEGWELPAVWDAVAGDYATADGWIRLHTNARAHRDAALSVLGLPADPVPGRETVAATVARWSADELEAAVVDARGCAAAMRDPEQWARHPQGRAVLAEPLMHVERQGAALPFGRQVDALRPLSGIRVLDLTRVLAGPVATRFLAGFGADVLRIDPPGWDEGAVIPEVTLGKRCARLDFKQAGDRERLKALLAEADILVHGYRPDALERLGLGADLRRGLNPGLVDVSLDAYGWSGPWAGRRGFDSLVQMSSGIAATGMAEAGAARPVPLPVQALDHGAGYLLAAAAVRGLVLRASQATGSRWRTSLARVGGWLAGYRQSGDAALIGKPEPHDYDAALEVTGWGPARRLKAPLCVGAARMGWDRPAGLLGTAPAVW